MSLPKVYRKNTFLKWKVPLTRGGVPFDLSTAIAIFLYIRTAIGQSDSDAIRIRLLTSPTNDLVRSVVGSEVDDDARVNALAEASTYLWDILTVEAGSQPIAPAADGDVFDATTFDSPGSTFQTANVVKGDYLKITTGTNLGEYPIAADPVSETQLIIDGTFPDPAEAAGQTFTVERPGGNKETYWPQGGAQFTVEGGGA